MEGRKPDRTDPYTDPWSSVEGRKGRGGRRREGVGRAFSARIILSHATTPPLSRDSSHWHSCTARNPPSPLQYLLDESFSQGELVGSEVTLERRRSQKSPSTTPRLLS